MPAYPSVTALDEQRQRRHFAGAGAIGLLSALLRFGVIPECHRDDAQKLVDEWDANAPAVAKAPE